jgi:hypothetical protein
MKLESFGFLVALLGSLHAGAWEGRVIDGVSRKPIPGVVLVTELRERILLPVQPASRCRSAEIATSDVNGRFVLRSPRHQPDTGTGTLRVAYKPGYAFAGIESDGAEVILLPLSDDPARRIEQVTNLKIPFTCSRRQIRPLADLVLRPAYEEATSLVVTAQEWDQVDVLLYAAERLNQGDDAADENREKRMSKRPPYHLKR